MFDLTPAARGMSRLIRGVTDPQLGLPTPCPGWSVADLVAHVHQLSTVFTDNARGVTARPPERLVADWRTAVPDQLEQLASAWADPSAWEGRTAAGGVEMAAADNAVVAVEELTVHAWDLATATGQLVAVDDTTLDQVDRFFEVFGEQLAAGQGAFGTPIAAPQHATRLERTVARTGRDVAWTPAG